MTSEAFVYLMLPGETTFVATGRFVLTEDRHGAQLGALYMVAAISLARMQSRWIPSSCHSRIERTRRID